MVDVAERLDVTLVGIFIASIRMEKVYAVDVGFGTILKGSGDWVCAREERWARAIGWHVTASHYRYGYREDSTYGTPLHTEV